MATNTDSAPSEYLRLHITPFNPSLLTAILPPSIIPNARNITYHNIQTFPERDYGYVDLPTMDAENIKKKLNGSILKGTKVKIDTARPQKVCTTDDSEDEEPRPKKEQAKKRKRGEILGVDIGERQVKRGWTTPGAKMGKDEKKIKSKYTTGPECLFKTVLPPNVAANGTAKDAKPKRHKNRKGSKEAVVHEFSKTTKYATFLRGPSESNKSKKGVAEYVDGKGWVDEDGEVIEVVKITLKVKPKEESDSGAVDVSGQSSSDKSSKDNDVVGVVAKKGSSAGLIKEVPIYNNADTGDTASEGSSSEDNSDHHSYSEPVSTPRITKTIKGASPTLSLGSSSDEKPEDKDTEPSLSAAQPTKEGSQTSSSGTSSEGDSDSDSSSSEEESSDAEVEMKKSSRPTSTSGPSPGLSITIPGSFSSTPVSAQVHPLEALYKRANPNATNTTPKTAAPLFSFFGADEDVEMRQESTGQVPRTPFTQRDFEHRSLRSAAPTPDTAHPNKKFIWPSENDEDIEEADSAAASPIRKEKGKGKVAQKEVVKNGKEDENNETDFQKWFYENRGDTNRAWKKRRKVVAKENRQRQNRKREARS